MKSPCFIVSLWDRPRPVKDEVQNEKPRLWKMIFNLNSTASVQMLPICVRMLQQNGSNCKVKWEVVRGTIAYWSLSLTCVISLRPLLPARWITIGFYFIYKHKLSFSPCWNYLCIMCCSVRNYNYNIWIWAGLFCLETAHFLILETRN